MASKNCVPIRLTPAPSALWLQPVRTLRKRLKPKTQIRNIGLLVFVSAQAVRMPIDSGHAVKQNRAHEYFDEK